MKTRHGRIPVEMTGYGVLNRYMRTGHEDMPCLFI